MLAEEIREYCLAKKGVTEGFPFNETTLVFKVGDKMFLLMDLESQPLKFSAKADPEWSEDLREQYHQITGAYHMNKTHWNTVYFEGLPESVLSMMVDESYRSVLSKLPKKIQKELLQ